MDFLAAVDAAVDEALPPAWPRVAPERLARQMGGTARVRHAFRLWAGAGEGAEVAAGVGRTPYLGIVVLPRPAGGALEAQEARELLALRDHALARGARLLLLFEQERLDRFDEVGGFVATTLDLPHPRWLALGCAPGAGGVWSAEATAAGVEPLAGILRDLWRGDLRFAGPRVGQQTVGVELMRDACWCCEQPIATVTGIVFPDREVTDWASCEWLYYRRLLPVAEIEPRTMAALAEQVERWMREGHAGKRITPLGMRSTPRSSPPARRSSWAALCPDCGALRGAFLVGADRLDLLPDMESRKRGRLAYRPWQIDVSYELIQALAAGTELSAHACGLGWRRERLETEAGRGLDSRVAAMVAGAPPGSSSGTAVPSPPAPQVLAALADKAVSQAAKVLPGAAGPSRGVVAAGFPTATRRQAPSPTAGGKRRRIWQALSGVRTWAVQKGLRRRS